MPDQLPPECWYCSPWPGSVSRIDKWQWMCSCCGKHWKVGEKRPEQTVEPEEE